MDDLIDRLLSESPEEIRLQLRSWITEAKQGRAADVGRALASDSESLRKTFEQAAQAVGGRIGQ